MERILETVSCDLRGKQTSVSVQFLDVNSAPCSRIIESCWAMLLAFHGLLFTSPLVLLYVYS